MSAALIAGVLLVAAPFVGVFALITISLGWREAVAVFATTAAVIAVVSLGVYLISATK